MTTAMYIIAVLLAVAVCIAACVIINIRKEKQETQLTELIQAQHYINTLENSNEELQEEKRTLQEKITALKSKITALESKEAEEKAPEEVKEQLPDKEAIPDGLTNRHLFMDYRTITNKRSEQWKLQEKCLTDNATGARYLDCDCGKVYTVALAANYGNTIGDCWLVMLDNGNCFYIMLAEYKDDGSDPLRMGDPCKNYKGEDVTNVVEFIIDNEIMPKYIYENGSLSAHPFFDGNIAKMCYLGCIDWKG